MRNIISSFVRLLRIYLSRKFNDREKPISDNVELVRTVDGFKFKYISDNLVIKTIYKFGSFEANTIRHALQHLKIGQTVVDIGANIGAYTIPLAANLKNGVVHAFEPNPTALAYLRENIQLNAIENVRVIPKGLADKKDQLRLYHPSLTTASFNKHLLSDEFTDVDVITLDEYCTTNDIAAIDVLKIDTEGHELKVLKGAENIIRNSPNMLLIVEIDNNVENVGLTRQELFEYIINLGFWAYLPKPSPFPRKLIREIPESYEDNILFYKVNPK